MECLLVGVFVGVLMGIVDDGGKGCVLKANVC